RREVLLEWIGVNLEDAVRSLAEDEREGLERLRRAEPREAGLAPRDRRPETLRVLRAHDRVQPVRREDHVARPQLRFLPDLAVENELDAQLAAARVEDLEQSLARHAAEAVARRSHARVGVPRLDVAPVHELPADLRVRLGIGFLEVRQRL